MRLTGYIKPFKELSFTIPIYFDGNSYFYHSLSDDYSITKFNKTKLSSNYIENLAYSENHKLGSSGVLVFYIGPNDLIVGPAKSSVVKIWDYIININLPPNFLYKEIINIASKLDIKLSRDFNDEILSIDIGNNKVCAVVAKATNKNSINVSNYGIVKSEGIKARLITRKNKTVEYIREAIGIAIGNIDFNFKNIHVSISGKKLHVLKHASILMKESSERTFTSDDISRLKNDMQRLVLPAGFKILHVIPQNYIINGSEVVSDPLALTGYSLEIQFLIIAVPSFLMKQVNRCFEELNLKVSSISLNGIAASFCELSKIEIESGVVLIDFGAGTVDITILKDSIIRHVAILPLAGNIITQDISTGFSLNFDVAEKLKVRFGSALADEIVRNRIISIPGLNGEKTKEISEKNLSKIIQARVTEIFDFILYEIKRSGFERMLNSGIVLTGGGSLLKNINLLAQYHTGLNSRISDLTDPSLSNAVGLISQDLKSHITIETNSKISTNALALRKSCKIQENKNTN